MLASDTPFKLAPSMLTFLWKNCKRCFWLKARHGLNQPWMPFPSVFERLHEVLQRHFTGRCPSTLHPTLPPGQCLSRETWVQSKPFAVSGSSSSFFFKGHIDHLMRFDDGTWGLIEYKTTEADRRKAELYARQLHAYAWALERAEEAAGLPIPITRMGLLCVEPSALRSFTMEQEALLELRPAWIEVERDDAGFERFVKQVAEVLGRTTPPPAGSMCTTCRYVEQRRALAQRMIHQVA